jgi:hypothetical protein
MTDREVLIKEIDTLSPRRLSEVVDFVEYIKHKSRKTTVSLEKAAERAYGEYRNNKDLTVFSVLDGADFYETG